MITPITDNPIEAQLLADLERVSAWFVERLADKPMFYQFSSGEHQRAGELGYICDLLVSLGHDRHDLSEERGWGYINAQHRSVAKV